MKKIEIRAGEKTRILQRFSNSIITEYQFNAEPQKPGETMSGVVEVSGSNWIFPKPPVQQALERVNVVKKGMWDSLYSVYVTPDCDVTVAIKAGKTQYLAIYLLAGLVVFIAALSIVFMGGR